MGKRVVSLLVVLMLACAMAFAWADGSQDAAEERWCGVWVADGLAVEIWREDEAFQCRAVFSDGGEASDIWEYAACFYDEADDALQCYGVTRTRERFDALLDTIDVLDWSMDDMSLAELRLSEEGMVFTDDALASPVALTRLGEAAPDEKTEALAFAGLWKGDSTALRMEDHGACYRFTVTVPVDAETSNRWSCICHYDSATKCMTSVNVSPRVVITREADGSITEVEEEFVPGDAVFTLENGNMMVWKNTTEGEETSLVRATD